MCSHAKLSIHKLGARLKGSVELRRFIKSATSFKIEIQVCCSFKNSRGHNAAGVNDQDSDHGSEALNGEWSTVFSVRPQSCDFSPAIIKKIKNLEYQFENKMYFFAAP